MDDIVDISIEDSSRPTLENMINSPIVDDLDLSILFLGKHATEQSFVELNSDEDFMVMLGAAKTYSIGEHDRLLKELAGFHQDAIAYLDKNHNKLWSRSKFGTKSKCDYMTNNISEAFNSWIGLLHYQPVLDMLDSIREKIMKRFDKKRRINLGEYEVSRSNDNKAEVKFTLFNELVTTNNLSRFQPSFPSHLRTHLLSASLLLRINMNRCSLSGEDSTNVKPSITSKSEICLNEEDVQCFWLSRCNGCWFSPFGEKRVHPPDRKVLASNGFSFWSERAWKQSVFSWI
ncbi:hypothetical protein CTI12_AA422390 [Artemisia annua]|uniref:Uncharacterized protein n=1 Tax=Artemisia annua TaxID=35608 RepID=A0A2U1M3W9_ARTAN|nr:hypothetical protein CTI12_AA422390 [Artemisia annua]